MSSDFFPTRCTASNLDGYLHRRAIAGGLQSVLPRLHGRLLDVGCGRQPYREFVTTPPSRVTEYVGLDFGGGRYGEPDVRWDGTHMPFADGAFNCALMTEVLEHCPHPEQLLSETFRVLAQGGVVYATVPFLWPFHDVPQDEYRYTPFALKRLFTSAGFSAVDVLPTGGWDASLAQMIGLWVLRRPMPSWKRSLVARAAVPLVKWLLKKDVKPGEFYDESNMCPGLIVIAGNP